MTTEMSREIAETMMIKVNCFNLYKNEYKNNQRECPWRSELTGMEQMLKIMGIEFEYTFDLETYLITGVTVNGITVMACDIQEVDIMYETWVVDECGTLLFRASEMDNMELMEYLDNHPEHSTRCVECDWGAIPMEMLF